MKRYAMKCKDFGRRFTFTAKDDKEATLKGQKWCAYHSFSFKNDYYIEEVKIDDSLNDLHNEYIF